MNIINTVVLTSESLKAHAPMVFGLSVSELFKLSNILPSLLFLLLMGNILILTYYVRKNILQKRGNVQLEFTNQQLILKVKRLQENLQQVKISKEKLNNINTTKDKFFSIIAHDLKGPLNSLTGLLQLLIKYADSFSKEELKDFGTNMNKSVNNLLDLLENLLHWSQTQSGMVEYCPEEVNIYELINKTANLLSPSADTKNIRIEVNTSEGIVVFADRNMISFTLRNLISNAIKFTNSGGTVSVYSSLKDDVAEIAIVDTGIGMTKEDIQKLFRIDKCYTTNGTANEIGTGLGLILCNEFIEKNKGKITVESSLNKGSVFRFYLPAVTSSEQIPIEEVY